MSDRYANVECVEVESVAEEASSRPPAGGDVRDVGVFDGDSEREVLVVRGASVDVAGEATGDATGTPSVPMAVRAPANRPIEINMVAT